LSGIAHESNFPRIAKDSYRFSEDPTREDPRGEFVEFPITTLQTSLFRRVGDKMRIAVDKERYAAFGDGSGIPLKISILQKVRKAARMLSLDGAPNASSEAVMRLPYDTVVVISHPKLMNSASLDAMDGLASGGLSFGTIHEAASTVNEYD
jgi:hypothetical protein